MGFWYEYEIYKFLCPVAFAVSDFLVFLRRIRWIVKSDLALSYLSVCLSVQLAPTGWIFM